MERDGQLVFTRRQCYALPERLDLLKGTVIGHRDGYGFARRGPQRRPLPLIRTDEDVYSRRPDPAQPLGADRKGRREARVVRVLVPKPARSLAATLPMPV